VRLLDRYLASPDDPALRREVSDRIRTVLHDAVDVLGPTYAEAGVGVAKASNGAYLLHAVIRHRTKELRSDLDLALDGFHPETWPSRGSVVLIFRITAFAGGSGTKGYVYETADVEALAAVATFFAGDGYVAASLADAPHAGSFRGTLCERTIEVSAARMFDDDAATAFARLLATEHERMAGGARKWLLSAR
jgi:hypothetical protein